MLGLSTLAELRLAAYGLLLAAISGWLIYEHHHLISEGEARIKAQDASARAKQKAEDESISKGVIDDLQIKLADLSKPAPHRIMRLCVPTSVVRAEPASTGTQPPLDSTSGEGTGGMPQGTPGLDIGGDVQNAIRASEVIALYRDETWDWAMKQSGH